MSSGWNKRAPSRQVKWPLQRSSLKARAGFFFFCAFACLLPSIALASLPPSLQPSFSQPQLVVGTLQSSVAEWTGKRQTVVLFLSPVCPCSRYHEPALSKLAAQFPQVRFIGVYAGSESMTEQEARVHFEKANLGFPVVRDGDLKIADFLGAHRTPHAFVFSESGSTLYQGAVDDKRASEPSQRYLEDVLTSLQDGKTLQLTQTRPMGCRIER